MSQDDPVLEEVGVLLAALIEGGLFADQRERLAELLREHPEAKQFYKRYLELHAMLEWEAGVVTNQQPEEDTLQDLLAMERAAEVVVVEPPKLVHPQGPKANTPWQIGGALRYLAGQTALWGGMAAVLAVAVVLFVVFSGGNETPSATANNSVEPGRVGPSNPGSNTIVATLTAEHEARWVSESLAPGSPLRAGQRLTLTQGFAEITTQRGAVAVIEAPASIELVDNPNAIRLHRGKLVGLCHTDSSKGFVVKTDYADITDLGTEFGVLVQDNRLTTTVFTGEVDVAAPGGEPQRLISNQTAELNVDGNDRKLQVKNRVARGFNPLLKQVTAMAPELDPYQIKTDGSARLLAGASRPESLLLGLLESDQRLHVVLEQTGVSAGPNLRAGIIASQPGTYRAFVGPGKPVAYDGNVDSYLVHLDPVKASPVAITGEITFPRPIVAVCVNDEQLVATDERFADPAIVLFRDRDLSVGLDGGKPEITEERIDELTLSDDGRTLRYRLVANRWIDEFRVLIQAAEPTP